MKSASTLSIITATYNSQETIKDTLESVLRQTVLPDELLIIDGNSVDDTLTIVNSYLDKLPIRIISESDEGIYDAMNKGLRHCSCEIIGFLNSDDVFATQTCIHDLKNTFDTFEADIVYGNLVYVAADNLNRVTRRWISGLYSPDKLGSGWCMPHPAFYIRRHVLQSVGHFNLKYRLAADYDFIWRCLLTEHFNIVYLNKIIVKMREGGATSGSLINIFRQNIEIVDIVRNCKVDVNIPMFLFNKVVLKIVHRVVR